jgi:RNA polymerase sigma-70 factor (ECF subfamily)
MEDEGMNHQKSQACPDQEWSLLTNERPGQAADWNEIMLRHRDRLRRMVEMRMHPRLQGRVDASDVIQETFIEAARVLNDGKQNQDMPVYIWLRRLANQKLIQAHRRHLQAAGRDARREQAHLELTEASSVSIARLLIGNFTSPSLQAIRQERESALQHGLEQLEPLDREVLALRHFEQLSGPESAEILGISHDAVKKRYIRALEKLQRIMVQQGMVDGQ